MLTRVSVAAAVELGYALTTRVWLGHLSDPVERELAITAVRAATIPIHWALFRDFLRTPRPHVAPARDPLVALAIVLLLLAPALTDAWNASVMLKLVFALTSLVVGVREELVYRGILQGLLERRVRWEVALILSNVVFVVYHYGSLELTASRIATILLVGSAFGILYHATGSLVLVMAIHGAYDAVAALTPLMPQPLPLGWGTALQAAAVVVLVLWVRRTRPG